MHKDKTGIQLYITKVFKDFDKNVNLSSNCIFVVKPPQKWQFLK